MEKTKTYKLFNDWQTMHKAMSVLYRPITNKIGNNTY